MTDLAKMVDISGKKTVRREAVAEGFIHLNRRTLKAVLKRSLEKGDVIEIAKVAGIMAAKRTPEIVPLCHPIQLESVDVSVKPESDGLKVRSRVVAFARTGVEMEALTSVSASLLAAWDVVKKLEKDSHGQYPSTAITGIRVLEKVKGE
jgi:cyclic pyranopterin phosphate synthase